MSYTNNVNAATATAGASFAGDDGRTGSTGSAIFTITPTTPVITWATPADIIDGTALSTQLNATADVPGAFAYTPSAGTLSSAGSGQILSATFTPTDTADYTAATKTVTINVLTPAQAAQQLGATVSGLVRSGVLTPSAAGAPTAKLAAAVQQLASGNNTAAKGQLGAFINRFNALVNSHRLTQAQGQTLIDPANAVIARL